MSTTITPWLESNETIAFPFTEATDGDLDRLVVDAYISYRSPRNTGKVKVKYFDIVDYPGSGGIDTRFFTLQPNNILDDTAQYEGFLSPETPIFTVEDIDLLNEGWIVKLVLEFEDHEILFHSDEASTFKALSFDYSDDANFVLLEWTFNRLEPAGFEGFDVVKLVINSNLIPDLTFPIEPTNAFFVEQTIQCDPIQLNSITFEDEIIKGKVLLDVGYNMEISVTADALDIPLVAAEETEQTFNRNKQVFNISAVAGAGAGTYLNCADPDAFIKTVNGTGGSDNGNLVLNATECYWPEFLGSNLGSEFLPTTSPTIKLRNVCGACCTCEQYYDTYEGIRVLWTKLKVAIQRLEQARSFYEGMVELYHQVCPESDPNYTGTSSGSGGSGTGGTGTSGGSGSGSGVVLNGPAGSGFNVNDRFSVHVFLQDQLAWTGWMELCFYNRGTTTVTMQRDYQIKILPFDFSTQQAGDPSKLLIPGNHAKHYYNALSLGEDFPVVDSTSFIPNTVSFHNGVFRFRSSLVIPPGNFEFICVPIYLEDFDRPESGKSWREDYISDNFIYGITTKLELWTPDSPRTFVHNGDNQTLLRPPFTRT
jgi:hypothetical protein